MIRKLVAIATLATVGFGALGATHAGATTISEPNLTINATYVVSISNHLSYVTVNPQPLPPRIIKVVRR